MTRSPILIRVDATHQTGYERLARTLIFAAAVQRRRRPVHFVSRLDPASLALQIRRGGNEWIPAEHPAGSPEDLKFLHQQSLKLQPAAIVVDEGNVTTESLHEMRDLSPLLFSMDHVSLPRFPSSLLVNPLLGPSRESFEFTKDTHILMGKRYALVRPEIRRARAGRSQEPPPIALNDGKSMTSQFRALVALGEDDPHGQTLELVKLLLTTPRIGKVDIIVRRENAMIDDIRDFAAAEKDRVVLALEPAEVAARLVRCHFAITGGGGWSNELACIGIPQLLILQNEAHWPNAQRLEEEGVATCLGWHESISQATVRSAVQNLITDPLERQAMARCGRKLIDGRGPDRMVNAMEILLAKQPLPAVVPMAA